MVSIAIDGPSGAGKSTLAKRLAKELGYIYAFLPLNAQFFKIARAARTPYLLSFIFYLLSLISYSIPLTAAWAVLHAICRL